MKLVREYPIPRIYSDEAYDCYCQTALYKPTAEELALLNGIWDDAEMDYDDRWHEFDAACAEMTGCYDTYPVPGGRYVHYSFRLTPSGLLSVTATTGLDI